MNFLIEEKSAAAIFPDSLQHGEMRVSAQKFREYILCLSPASNGYPFYSEGFRVYRFGDALGLYMLGNHYTSLRSLVWVIYP